MKGLITEIISADLSVNECNVNKLAEAMKKHYSDAEITTDGNFVFFYLKLKDMPYTSYPQTYWEPAEFNCDDWIYEEDFEEYILQLSSELGIDIDIENLSCKGE